MRMNICKFTFECRIGLSDKCNVFAKRISFAPITDVDSQSGKQCTIDENCIDF